MEASALQAPAGLARARISVGAPLLRLRSDEQLLALFRAGNDDAFRVIHDRYRSRLFAYTRQMLPGCKQDAEDALQDVFVRAYSGLRANRRQLALRPWLYRVAHNRCVDELRRPVPPAPEVLHQVGAPTHDPIVQAEQRESLRRLIADLRRLPDHQRSALLMRELGGMSYVDVAAAMDVSVPAVRSLLVRARIGLAQAVQARDTACIEIRDEMTLAHDRGVRASGTVRRHLADCDGCRHFRGQLRGSRRQFAALAPALGPMGVLAKMLGIGGGGAAGGGAGAAATGGATATTGAAVGGGTVASAGTLAAGASHVATLIAAAVVTAGGAVAIQHTITPPVSQRHAVHALAGGASSTSPVVAPLPYQSQSSAAPANAPAASTAPGQPSAAKHAGATTSASASPSAGTTSISGGDNIVPTAAAPGETTDSGGTATAGTTPTTGTTTPTGTDGTGTNGAANSTGAGTATGTASSTGDPSTSGSGTTGTADTSPGDSSSSGSGDPTAPKTGAGTTTGATTGTTTGTTSGTTTGTTPGPPTGT